MIAVEIEITDYLPKSQTFRFKLFAAQIEIIN